MFRNPLVRHGGIRNLRLTSTRFVCVRIVAVAACIALMSFASAANAAGTRLKIVQDRITAKELVYWFVAPPLAASSRHNLPRPGPDGAVFVDVPPAYDKPGAVVKILDAEQGLIAHIPVRDTAGRLSGSLSGPNLLQNSEFSREGEHWIAELNGGQAKGQIEWLTGADLPKGVTGKALRVRVVAIDAVNWHVQFHQTGLDLAEGAGYTLSFWARADRARPLSVNATVDKDDFHWVGLSNQFALTTEWRKFTIVFTATRVLENHNRLGFVMGDTVGAVDLAGITLQKGVAAGSPGANLLKNSTFTHGSEAWLTSVVAPAKAVTKTPSDEPAPRDVPGKCAQVDVVEAGTQNWNVQLFQLGIDLAEDQAYTLTFWAKSDQRRPINIIAGEDKEDYHTVGLDNFAQLEPMWRKYVYVFTATRTVRNSHRLTFLVGDSKGKFDLADVTLQPGAEAIANSSGGLETTLSPSDFRFSASVGVPVHYRGRPVEDLGVTLKYRDENIPAYKIQPGDRGIARFADVPIDEKLTVVVSDGAQSAEFPRIVASDSPGSVAPIEVPTSWTQIKTNKDLSGALLPFVGTWQSQATKTSQIFVTTFNADGTGTIKRIKAGASSEQPITAPPSGAFLWHLKANADRVIMVGSKQYTWSVSGTAKNEQLLLKEPNGSVHTLYRK